ncbi:MAG TPA: hypothetical protein PLD27_12955 [bacterium]|nr:hypothetical protein [bacterium]HPQ20116.1 hypothetical protein [bacterium]
MPLDTYKIYNHLRNIFNEDIAVEMMKVINEIIITIYEEQNRMAGKEEFNELKEIVKELAEAQKQSEERLDKLTEEVRKLAAVQKRTEQRVEELVEAQKNAEKQIAELSIKVTNLTHEVGKLASCVEYMLEDETLVYLPFLLKRDYNIEVLAN